MSDTNVTIIGGGVVGCAIAAACVKSGLSTVLLEKENGLGRGTTSRNSEVSHGGMYYPTGSMKARFCVAGRRLLKEFCLTSAVNYSECGKLIVALGEDEIPQLENLLALGQANGVEDLEILDAPAIRLLEPEVEGVAALLSPRTGIVDAEGVCRAFAQKASESGGQIMTSSVLESLEKKSDSWKVGVSSAADHRREGWSHSSDFVVNAAGLSADSVAAMAGVDVAARGWELVRIKGNYFRINPVHKGRVNRLVYPVPPVDHSSLGVHLCIDLAGQLRLGPDVEYLDTAKEIATDAELSYHVNPERVDSFFHGARCFLPWLEKQDLSPDMCGYRPKFAAHGFRDFVVARETGHLDGLINLMGIDSPGLTSAPALAEYVVSLLLGQDGKLNPPC